MGGWVDGWKMTLSTPNKANTKLIVEKAKN